MSDKAMLLALGAAERLLSTGADSRYAINRAAELHAVDRHELGVRVLQKFVQCERARAAIASLRDGDRPMPPAPKRKRVRRAI